MGGWIANAGSCKTGFMSFPSNGDIGNNLSNGLETSSKKAKKKNRIRLIIPSVSTYKSSIEL